MGRGRIARVLEEYIATSKATLRDAVVRTAQEWGNYLWEGSLLQECSWYLQNLNRRRARSKSRGNVQSGNVRSNFTLHTSYGPYENGPKIVTRVYDDGRKEVLYDQSRQG